MYYFAPSAVPWTLSILPYEVPLLLFKSGGLLKYPAVAGQKAGSSWYRSPFSEASPAPRSNLIDCIESSVLKSLPSRAKRGYAPRINVRMTRLFIQAPRIRSRRLAATVSSPSKTTYTPGVSSLNLHFSHKLLKILLYKHHYVLRNAPPPEQEPPNLAQTHPRTPLPMPPSPNPHTHLLLSPFTPKCPSRRRFIRKLLSRTPTHRVASLGLQSHSHREELAFQLHFQLPSIFGPSRT
jgi:hypothetical protein